MKEGSGYSFLLISHPSASSGHACTMIGGVDLHSRIIVRGFMRPATAVLFDTMPACFATAVLPAHHPPPIARSPHGRAIISHIDKGRSFGNQYIT